MKRNKRQIMTWPSMLVLFLFAFVPLIIMFVTSFKSDATGAFTLENYARFFQKAMYLKLTGKNVEDTTCADIRRLYDIGSDHMSREMLDYIGAVYDDNDEVYDEEDPTAALVAVIKKELEITDNMEIGE